VASQQLEQRFDESYSSGLSSYFLLHSSLQTFDVGEQGSDIQVELNKYPEINLSELRAEFQVV
jgi:hypothetical protein